MKIFEDIASLQAHLHTLRVDNSIGFVPTMGALHQGHISLIEFAKQKSDVVVCSIFVNPLQFNNPEDLTNYPSSIAADSKMLETAGCDILFLPSVEVMYGNVVCTKMTFEGLDNVMEGAFRAGHFSGVGVVVAKLFNLVKPNKAFFGQKDLQQFAIINQMNTDLSFGIELHCCPIIREEDGLAMSSRNRRLDEGERLMAPKIYETLILVSKLIKNNHTFEEAKQAGVQYLNKYKTFDIEYIEIVNANTLQSFEGQLTNNQLTTDQPLAICIAAHLGKIRLIDNLLLQN